MNGHFKGKQFTLYHKEDKNCYKKKVKTCYSD